MKISVTVITKKDNEFLVELPARNVVCPRCDGRGTHVNPSIDGNGIGSQDFAEDPEFKEAYFAGVYDVVCHDCDGRNVVCVVDIKACTPKMRQRYEKAQRRQANERAASQWEY